MEKNNKIQKIQGRVEKEMENKTKLRTVSEDKWERKEYIATFDSDLVKDIIRIRLHMWELKKNCPREQQDMQCLPHMQSKGRHNGKCTRVLNSRNSIQNTR